MRYVTCEPHAAMDLLATHFESEAILNTGSRLILQATSGRGVSNPLTEKEVARAHRMNAKAADKKRTVFVCSACHSAACWQGEFMCQESLSADIVEVTIEELERLGLEHPSWWDIDPDTGCARRLTKAAERFNGKE